MNVFCAVHRCHLTDLVTTILFFFFFSKWHLELWKCKYIFTHIIISRYIHSSSFWSVFLLLLNLLQGGRERRKDVLQSATHEKQGGGGIHVGRQQRGLGGQQLPDCTAVPAAGRPGLCRAAEWQAAMWDNRGPKHILWLLDLLHSGRILMYFIVV